MPIAGGILVAGSASRCLSSAAGMLRFLARLSGRRRHVRRSCGPGGGCCGAVQTGETTALSVSDCMPVTSERVSAGGPTTMMTTTATTTTATTTAMTTTTTTTTTTITSLHQNHRRDTIEEPLDRIENIRWIDDNISIGENCKNYHENERLFVVGKELQDRMQLRHNQMVDPLRENDKRDTISLNSTEEFHVYPKCQRLAVNINEKSHELMEKEEEEEEEEEEGEEEEEEEEEDQRLSSQEKFDFCNGKICRLDDINENQRLSRRQRLLLHHRTSTTSSLLPTLSVSMSTSTGTTTIRTTTMTTNRRTTTITTRRQDDDGLSSSSSHSSTEWTTSPTNYVDLIVRGHQRHCRVDHDHHDDNDNNNNNNNNDDDNNDDDDDGNDDERKIRGTTERKSHSDNSSFSNTNYTKKRTIPPYLATLLIISYTLFGIADACSSRSTPKPRPPTPTPRPNITFHMYTCPPDYAEWYCLNGATCFTVKIQESLLYNCLCANGFIGQRCEFKDLDGSYLPSRQRVMLETASIAGGATIAVFLVVIICIAAYIHCKRKQKELRTSSTCTDTVDGPGRDPELRPFSNRSRSLMIFMAKNPNASTTCPTIEQTRMPGWTDFSVTESARMASVNEGKRGSSQ